MNTGGNLYAVGHDVWFVLEQFEDCFLYLAGSFAHDLEFRFKCFVLEFIINTKHLKAASVAGLNVPLKLRGGQAG